MQETVLSKQCVLSNGKSTWSLQHIENFEIVWGELGLSVGELKALDEDYGEPDGFLDTSVCLAIVTEISNALSSCDQKLSLPRIMSVARRRRCRDPRDHVYGVLGIYTSMYALSENDIRVDYDEDIAATLTRATIHSLLNDDGGNLKGLIEAYGEDEGRLRNVERLGWRARLPSWVPDWTARRRVWKSRPSLYTAGGCEDLALKARNFSDNHMILEGM